MLSYDTQYYEAQNKYKKALEIDSNYATAYGNLGLTYYSINKYDSAEYYVSKSIKINPSSEAFNTLGLIEYEKHNLEGAIIYYKRSISLNPQYFVGYLNWGNALIKMDSIEEAVSIYDKAFNIDQSPYFYYRVGRKLFKNRYVEQCIKYYDNCIARDSNFAIAYLDLAMAMKVLGNIEKSNEILMKYNKKIKEIKK